jgi:hypothetical protein
MTKCRRGIRAGARSLIAHGPGSSVWRPGDDPVQTEERYFQPSDLSNDNYRPNIAEGASSTRDPHFQPGTRPACSNHLCISGPCASSSVVTLT